MGVGHRLMGVLVAVAASWHYYVHMCMVPIVVPVSMLMLQHFVRVLVSMAFRQMEHYSRQHEHSTQEHKPPRRAFPPKPKATAAPMKGAKANTEPVRAAPNARWARR